MYHNNGNIALEHTYNHGALNSFEKIFHEDGSLSGKLLLENGKYEGPFVYYHPEGTVKQKGYYKEDVMEGELCSYYVDGTLRECVTMKNNVEQGAFREYAPNGVLVRKGTYISILGDKEGLEDGLIYEYDSETRQLKTKKRCKEGFCCTIWERDKGYLKPTNSICNEIMNGTDEKASMLGSE
jgi:antitoxin component YwqK of YwqJK toxin-antitoxin module